METTQRQNIRIENLTRKKHVFPLAGADGEHEGYLILGGSGDGDESAHITELRRSGRGRDETLCPNPVRTLTLDEWNALGEFNLQTLRELEEEGQVTITGAPEPGAPARAA